MMSNQALIDALNTTLASVYGLYLKAQNYHWNVTGPNFLSYHELFEKLYRELRSDVDDIAERIRTLGPHVPTSFAEFEKNNMCKAGDHTLDAASMLADFESDLSIIIEQLQTDFKLASESEDEGTCALLGVLIEHYEKARWMISSSR